MAIKVHSIIIRESLF